MVGVRRMSQEREAEEEDGIVLPGIVFGSQHLRIDVTKLIFFLYEFFQRIDGRS